MSASPPAAANSNHHVAPPLKPISLPSPAKLRDLKEPPPPGWTALRRLSAKRESWGSEMAEANKMNSKMTATASVKQTPEGRDTYEGERLEEVRSDEGLIEESEGGGERGGVGLDGEGGGGSTTYRVYRSRWHGFVVLVLLNIVVSWDWLTWAANSSQSAKYYNVSETAINWLSTAFLFSFVVATPPTIYVLHRGGPKPAIFISAVLLLLGNWIRYGGTRAGEHGNYGVVMFGQILTGLAQPFVLSAPTRYSDLWFTNRGRVAATAVMSLANPFGGALAQAIDGVFTPNSNDTAGITNIVLMITIIATVATIPAFFLQSKPPTPVSHSSSTTTKLALLPSLQILARSPEFWMIVLPYWIYVALFNSFSTLINQILTPFHWGQGGFSTAGALLIFIGLLASAITSPLIDRSKAFLLAIKIAVPIIFLSYLVLIWAPESHVGTYIVMAVLGSASFCLVPVALEFLTEVTHPVGPELSSTVCWCGGQLLGGVFIVVEGKLKDANGDMSRALWFQAIVAAAVVPLPLCLGLFGRKEKVRMRRVEADKGLDGA